MVTKLKKVKIKDIWKTEDRDFTPWLVENINLLNEDVGLNIQDPKKENRLVNFIVDIVAEDEEGKVIIENQFHNSNHDHLGKLLTYLSNVEGTKKAIWIVEEAKSEHKNAIEWLNQNTTSCSFYLIKIQVFKIENSPPGAKFDLIAGPNESSKAMGKIKQEDTERHKLRLKFWSLFLEKCKKQTKMYSNISPNKYSWLGTGTGMRGIGYNVAVLKAHAQAEVYIDRGKDDNGELNKKIFFELKKSKDKIEKDFGSELVWEELQDSRASRICKRTQAGGYRDEETWEKVHSDLIEYATKMQKTFSPHIKNLQKKFK
tara:strand:+ start:121 stop:1065 length:945 start_codon:yes stop_codon:yes gene_type:complete